MNRADGHNDLAHRSYLKVNSCLEELTTVQTWFQGLVDDSSRQSIRPSSWVGKAFDQINLALTEGFTNAVRHAHADLPETTPILIECKIASQQIEIRIFDRGEPFDPDSLVEPKPGTLREGGYGWFLLRRLVNQVTYDRAKPTVLAESIARAVSVPSIYDYALPNSADVKQVKNCLRLVKLA